MSVFSKMYGFPIGYLNLLYKFLRYDGQINSHEDVIKLVKNFGYPKHMINKIAQELVCTDDQNIDALIDWETNVEDKVVSEIPDEVEEEKELLQQYQPEYIEERSEQEETDGLSEEA